MKSIGALRSALQDKLNNAKNNGILMHRVLNACNLDIPQQCAEHPEAYNRIVIANELMGINATTTREAFARPEGLGRIMYARVSEALAAHGNDIALLYRQSLGEGFHGRFSGSDAYKYIVDHKIFEKIITRRLTANEEESAKTLLNGYLSLAA